jgi:uncharacterized membrane protein AbrB (regulator of aidB expression)
MADGPRIDWPKFWIHAFCGAVFGVFIGVRSWGRSRFGFSHSWAPGIIIVIISVVLCGLLAGALSTTNWDE